MYIKQQVEIYERKVQIMLAMAWVLMGLAILTSMVLLGDLKREIEYNIKDKGNDCALIIFEGEHHGLQEANHRENRVILRRCC